jgi:SAM-dependent methyltransferase
VSVTTAEWPSDTRSKIVVCRFFDIHCHNIEGVPLAANANLVLFDFEERVNRLHHWLCRSAHWRKTLAERVPWVLSGADLGPNALEPGPGPGLTTDLLRSRVKHLTALEADPRLADSLRSRLHGTNVDIVTGDATQMPFFDAAFSGCASFTMLHHVPSAELQNQLLREVWRVLQPGGLFVGSDSLQSTFMKIIHLGDTLVLIDPDSFAMRLESAGFEVLRIDRSANAFRFQARRPGLSQPARI